ncbi:unnamed protein product [Malus baccata var. baccata]
MSAVVFMLGNEEATPSPKQPAFLLKRSYNSGDPSPREGRVQNYYKNLENETVSNLECMGENQIP